MKSIVKPLLAVTLTAFLTACGSFPKNPALESYQPEQGYRFSQLQKDAADDELFVIVSFSGGGSRAAALAFGVLEALDSTEIEYRGRRISLLQEVDVISSISGGSFPAAYYALRRERIFTEFPDKFLYKPIQSDLAGEAFSPSNWFKLGGSSYGRSDLAADYYDREVFAGATYADVIEQNRRPFVILNATDMSTGRQFPFIQDQFDQICSDLAGVPLARAAAASSAFPGLLTPLTFQNYAGECGYSQPGWVAQALKDQKARRNLERTARAESRLSYAKTGADRREYIHLIDGGVADNIGLRGPLTALRSRDFSWSIVRKLNDREIDKILVIVVNAATSPDTERDASAKVPGVFDTVNTAAGLPIDNYTFDTIDLLTSTVREYNNDARLLRACKRIAAAKGEQCKIDVPEPHQVDIYAAQVAFEYIASDSERSWFKNLPTNFELPASTVDKLRAVGRDLLSQDPEFVKFLDEHNGCLPTPSNPC